MLSTPTLIATTKRSGADAAQPKRLAPATPLPAARIPRRKFRREMARSCLRNMLVQRSMAPQEIDNRRMAFLRHLAQIAVPAAVDEKQLGVRYFFCEHLGRLDVVAGAALVSILAADNDQRRRPDLMDQVGGLVALPGNHVAQVAF